MLVIDKHIHFIKLDMFIFYPLAQLFQNSHVKRNTKHLFLNVSYDSLLAENTGFEPADALTSTVFKTAALNHSANSPHLFLRRSENRCNGLPKQNARFVLSFVGSLLISENSVANKTRFGKHFFEKFYGVFWFLIISSYCCFYLSWVLQNQFLFVIIEQKR